LFLVGPSQTVHGVGRSGRVPTAGAKAVRLSHRQEAKLGCSGKDFVGRSRAPSKLAEREQLRHRLLCQVRLSPGASKVAAELEVEEGEQHHPRRSQLPRIRLDLQAVQRSLRGHQGGRRHQGGKRAGFR
jgi:hypothetical protein